MFKFTYNENVSCQLDTYVGGMRAVAAEIATIQLYMQHVIRQ